MPEPFELPADLSALDDEQLAAALAGAVEVFDAKAKSNLVTADDITALRDLTSGIEAMRQEQHDRINAAKATAAKTEQLAAKVRGEDPAAAAAVEPSAVEPQDAPAPEPQDTLASDVAASASVAKRHALNLASVRAVQPRVLPEPPAPTTVITTAGDVPGYTPGAATRAENSAFLHPAQLLPADLGVGGDDRVDGRRGVERDVGCPGPACAEAHLDRLRGADPFEPDHVVEVGTYH
ncbi:hypothetical protein ACIRP2_38085 [Streptomyces sp. NPDC101194]|uniref:hypothetical protein n=1 Tax=Streptomyces sp. NPDC101194 TaxID=3366127 RepID=UPI00380CB37E